MVAEVVDVLRPVPPGVIVDATLGAGGHAAALLDALPDHTLVGLDRDDEALATAAGDAGPLRRPRRPAPGQLRRPGRAGRRG